MKFHHILFAILVAASTLLHAQSATPEDNLRKLLSEKFSGPRAPKIEHVRKTPYFGLYEFRFGRTLGYTDEKASYIIFGAVLDGQNLNNLSAARLEQLDLVKFSELPFNLAIKTVKGNGKRQIALFEDPNCGYCKLLQKELLNVDNITIHSFVLPILGQDSVEKAKQIWCAPNRQKAWLDWMQKNRMPDGNANCNAPLQQLVDLGERLNVNGTPAIIFADGSRISGAVSAEELEKKLKGL